jgi:hypothetical protein
MINSIGKSPELKPLDFLSVYYAAFSCCHWTEVIVLEVRWELGLEGCAMEGKGEGILGNQTKLYHDFQAEQPKQKVSSVRKKEL